ncbi:MAG: recombinase family protein [Ruminococcus sp.]|nr:recombinase family protein [Ruminococcus sp.]
MKKLRAAAYCRVSTAYEEQTNSLETQISHFTSVIKADSRLELVGIFCDRKSGRNSKREGFERLLKLCRKRKIDIIYTKSISRFGRNTVDFLKTMRKLKELNIRVVFENEGIDTAQPISEFFITTYAAFAQSESESKCENIRWGITRKFETGAESYTNRPCFGYKKREHHLEIVPNDACVVRQIFAEYICGRSLKDIAHLLETQNILSPKGSRKWSPQTIRNILQNEKYTGDVVLQKTFVENFFNAKQVKNAGQKNRYLISNCHVAIISKSDFETVQKLLAERSNMTTDSRGRTKQSTTRYSSSHKKIVCKECGRNYRRIVRHDGVVVWRCANRVEHGSRICKNSPTLKESELDGLCSQDGIYYV